jgi:hypothetical protein
VFYIDQIIQGLTRTDLKKIFLTAFFCILFIAFANKLSAQKVDRTTLGVSFRPIIPSALFDNTGLESVTDKATYTLNPQLGFSAGVVLRQGLYKQFSLESGINYVERIYNSTIKSDSANYSNKIHFVNYEVPVLCNIYVRTAQQSYLTTAFGFSFDFFPNDVSVPQENYTQKAVRHSWVLPGLVAQVGYEFRTAKNGFFYVGGTYHRMLESIAYTGFLTPDGFQTSSTMTLNGHYFALEFKYFFPTTHSPAPEFIH